MKTLLLTLGLTLAAPASALAQKVPVTLNKTVTVCARLSDAEKLLKDLVYDQAAYSAFYQQKAARNQCTTFPSGMEWYRDKRFDHYFSCIRPAGSTDCFWTLLGDTDEQRFDAADMGIKR